MVSDVLPTPPSPNIAILSVIGDPVIFSGFFLGRTMTDSTLRLMRRLLAGEIVIYGGLFSLSG